MMKVLVVSGEYPPMKGGVGRYTFNLVHALAKKSNIDVSVAISSAAGTAAVSAPSSSFSSPHSPLPAHATIATIGAPAAGPKSNKVTIYPGIVRKGDKQNSDHLLQLVSQTKPDIVNIQYERGLYEVDTTIRHTIWRLVHGSTLDQFYRKCPVPVVSTLHTVFPEEEYRSYVKDRALRKEGRFGFLPMPLRAAIRRWVMEQRYDLLLEVVRLSDGIISPARTIKEVVRRGTVIYHGAEPAIEVSSSSSSANGKQQQQQLQQKFRNELGLPTEKMLLLAFGYAGSYKGFDVLGSLRLPNGWSLVVKQTKHERGSEKPIDIRNNGDSNSNDVVSLHLGYLDDTTLSKLFFACDAIIFPYKIVSVSGVMFDSLAHGLPFVASNLRFFKEFADMGLGIICNRDMQSFEQAVGNLAMAYDEFKTRVEQFRSNLRWDNVAQKHVEFFLELISQQNTKGSNERPTYKEIVDG
jgi:glycosyltransferase involved in cell wall biosynthesis